MKKVQKTNTFLKLRNNSNFFLLYTDSLSCACTKKIEHINKKAIEIYSFLIKIC